MENSQHGLLTGEDIKYAVSKQEIIIAPYNEENVTPVGYNFSYSMFIMSLNTRKFQKIEEDKEGKLFFYIKPSETVLILTLEAIKVPSNVGGTFHSKVSVVTDGLSHVSTTLDPGWSGQLLIPMNNPTNKKIRVNIGRNKGYDKNQNDPEFYSFITLVLFKAITPNKIPSDNKSNRLELLESKLHGLSKDNALSTAIRSMKTQIENFDNYCKEPNVLPEDKAKKFQDTYKKLATENKNQFNEIISNTKKQKIAFKLILIAIIVAIIATLSVIIWLGFKFEPFRWIAPTLVAIIVSALIATFKPLKDLLL